MWDLRQACMFRRTCSRTVVLDGFVYKLVCPLAVTFSNVGGSLLIPPHSALAWERGSASQAAGGRSLRKAAKDPVSVCLEGGLGPTTPSEAKTLHRGLTATAELAHAQNKHQ